MDLFHSRFAARGLASSNRQDGHRAAGAGAQARGTPGHSPEKKRLGVGLAADPNQ